MAKKRGDASLIDSNPGEIRVVNFSQALSERYLAYALSTIMSRSLPDVRDGLKPVQRRILYAMRELKLNPDSGYKKSARVVGDVIGKFHPHGDSSIYDAMVRLAQEFAQRYPLVDGQGNFGNIDGDNAAAMRYTEARMTAVSRSLLEGIDQDTVDFRPTYDAEDNEPVVLPANFPNLLANGAQGIAVGMATSIPPHNVGEICDALRHLIKFPNASITKLVDFISGPDFPTGGVLVEGRDSIISAYETGKGGFRVRSKWEVEKLKGGSYQIVVTEIPYQVQKSRLIERIADLIHTRKLIFLGDVRDESSEEIRLVLEPKSRNVDPAVLMESLFKQTDLETRISLNMNALNSENVPQVMSLREVLRAFLDHRRNVLVRRSQFRLGKIDHRLEILEGFLIAYLNIDELIRIIREDDHPKQVIMSTFDLTEVQAESILNMRLRSLRRLEEEGIRKEHYELIAEREGLVGLLESEDQQWQSINGQIKEIKALYGSGALGDRRTEIGDIPEEIEIPLEAMIEKEPVTVILSAKGWIRAMKGHGVERADVKYKEGDEENFVVPAYRTDKFLVFSGTGRFYTLPVDRLPGGRGFGEPLSLMVDLEAGTSIIEAKVYEADNKLLVASTEGRGFVVEEKAVMAQTRSGKKSLNVSDSYKAKFCIKIEGDSVAVVGQNRKLLIFAVEELPEMARGKGVMLQKYKDGGLSDVKTFTLEKGLSWRWGQDKNRTETDLIAWQGKRASAGRMAPNGFPKNNKFY